MRTRDLEAGLKDAWESAGRTPPYQAIGRFLTLDTGVEVSCGVLRLNGIAWGGVSDARALGCELGMALSSAEGGAAWHEHMRGVLHHLLNTRLTLEERLCNGIFTRPGEGTLLAEVADRHCLAAHVVVCPWGSRETYMRDCGTLRAARPFPLSDTVLVDPVIAAERTDESMIRDVLLSCSNAVSQKRAYLQRRSDGEDIEWKGWNLVCMLYPWTASTLERKGFAPVVIPGTLRRRMQDEEMHGGGRGAMVLTETEAQNLTARVFKGIRHRVRIVQGPKLRMACSWGEDEAGAILEIWPSSALLGLSRDGFAAVATAALGMVMDPDWRPEDGSALQEALHAAQTACLRKGEEAAAVRRQVLGSLDSIGFEPDASKAAQLLDCGTRTDRRTDHVCPDLCGTCRAREGGWPAVSSPAAGAFALWRGLADCSAPACVQDYVCAATAVQFDRWYDLAASGWQHACSMEEEIEDACRTLGADCGEARRWLTGHGLDTAPPDPRPAVRR